MTWFKEVVFMLLIRIRGGTHKKNPETKSQLPGKAKAHRVLDRYQLRSL